MDRGDATGPAIWGGTFFQRPAAASRGMPVQNGNSSTYRNLYRQSVDNLEQFWAGRAEELLSWSRPWDSVLAGEFNTGELRWFAGGKLNPSYNCLDRHLGNGRRNQAALIWQGENDREVVVFTYQMLHLEVCRFANVLKKKGIGKGDRVTIYLPMVPELVIAMLACARLGAIHCVVFSGFSSASLQTRMADCNSRLLITADAIFRAGRAIPMKPNADEALEECSHVRTCIVVRRAARDVSMVPGRDSWWHEEVSAADISSSCEPVEMAADDTLFVLYTSGATGKPKGVVHSVAGYLLYAMHSCQWVFDLGDEDIFWCTADIGWITGHSYAVYGPLGLGGTVLLYEGMPLFPAADRFWRIVEKFRVTIFYTAPTVIRALMRYGSEPVAKHDISSLRLLGSVGEPINAEVWHWYHEQIGRSTLPLVDTWLQTETGGIMIAPLPGTMPLKPGSAAQPLPGIDAVIVDGNGVECAVDVGGRLVIRKPWPGMLKDLHCAHDLCRTTYFASPQGCFNTGDGARRDADGFFWISGRLDDVIHVSGHRLGTAEIEAALLAHRGVAEAAVVGVPDPVKGQAVYAYVTLKSNVELTADLLTDLAHHVRARIGAIACPDVIQCARALPKTRSGKTMRRVLKKIAADDVEDFGDISSLADPSVIADLIEGKHWQR